MKTNIKTIIKFAAIVVTGIGLVSCETSQPAGKSAVMCDKCKTVWVNRPTQIGAGTKGGPGFVAYRDVKTMQCPDCESAVTTFFKTGSLKHHCGHCDGNMTQCEH